jgi:hypothetical protein
MTRPPVATALRAVALAAAVGWMLAGCSGGDPRTGAATGAAASAAASDPTTVPPVTAFVPAVSLPPSAIADPGLPSHVGPGPLDQGTVQRLMQYFEGNVAQAYAEGDARLLDHYLAGPMLTGNAGTINFLDTQHKHNVFQIPVTGVELDSNSTDRVVFDIAADMTLDYFVDTSDNQVLDGGLPGPSTLDFLCFVDFNPANRTWYWTGEQDESGNANDGEFSSGSGG